MMLTCFNMLLIIINLVFIAKFPLNTKKGSHSKIFKTLSSFGFV